MERTISIGDKQVTFKSSAALPRVYKSLFGSDVIKDMTKLGETAQKNDPDFTIFEQVAYTMAYLADRDIGTIDEWLDQFDSAVQFYQCLPQVFELWTAGITPLSKPRKK